jgi:hypothetical protein
VPADPTPPGYLYYVSPCRTVQGQQGCTTANIGVCQVSQRGDPFNVGGLAEAVTEARTTRTIIRYSC